MVNTLNICNDGLRINKTKNKSNTMQLIFMKTDNINIKFLIHSENNYLHKIINFVCLIENTVIRKNLLLGILETNLNGIRQCTGIGTQKFK